MELVMLKDHEQWKKAQIVSFDSPDEAKFLIDAGIAIERGAPQNVSVQGIPSHAKVGFEK